MTRARDTGSMKDIQLPVNQVIHGDCVEVMESLPASSTDLVFADPPYNLQLSGELWRPNMTRVEGVDDGWDQFESFQDYDDFSRKWLSSCRRVLKDDGTIWVIGTYHNIFRLGAIMQDLGYWILNDILWIKTNPMPNFHGVRFTNAHETLIWAAKSRHARYTFNHHAMKGFNDGKQMRSDWVLPLCTGSERIKIEGRKAHSAQKPEALLYRVLLSSTDPGDIVLDPFFGTGTTGAVAKKLHRQWIGIEADADYVRISQERLSAINPEPFDEATFDVKDRRRRAPRVPFAQLLELGFINPGQPIYFQKEWDKEARVRPDGLIEMNGLTGSIHQVGRILLGEKPCNGWDHWFVEGADGTWVSIDTFREEARRRISSSAAG